MCIAKALAKAGASFTPALFPIQHGSGRCQCTGHRFPAVSEGTLLQSYLHEAAVCGNDALLRFAIGAAGAPPDPRLPLLQQSDTPLGWAVRAGRTETVRLLLSLGADPSLSAAVRGLGPAGPDTEHYLQAAGQVRGAGKAPSSAAYAAALRVASDAAGAAAASASAREGLESSQS